MNVGLAQLYSAYQPKAKKKLKHRSKPQRNANNAALNSGARRPPHYPPLTDDHFPPRSGKSAEPQRLPKLARLQSRTPDPCHFAVKQALDRSASSAADITLDRLEKLQFKSITARSEWLLVQERKLALSMLNRHLGNASLDEMEELVLEDKYEVLLHKQGMSKRNLTPSYLPPLRRGSPL